MTEIIDQNRSAVVIGAAGGLGRALEQALRAAGEYAVVHGFSRSRPGALHLDLHVETSIAAAAAHVAQGPLPALVIVATGFLHSGLRGPEKSLRQLDPGWLADAFAVNAIGPAIVAKHFLPLMPRDRRSVFAVLSARVGSIEDNRLGGWHGYRASKAALNMLVRNFAIEQGRRNRESIVVSLHPGTVDTALSRPFQGGLPAGQLVSPQVAARRLLDVIDRLEPCDSGMLIDHAGARIPF